MDSVQTANVKSSLYLMDTISYVAQAMGDLEGKTVCTENPSARCNEVWKGANPATNIPAYLNPKLLEKLPRVLPDLGFSQRPTAEEVEQKLLSDPSSNADLRKAVETIEASTLTPKEKAKVIAALYLMDVISYIAYNMENLDAESQCGAADASCGKIWYGNDPAAENIPPRLKPNTSTLITLFRLAATTPAEELQTQLEESYLTSPYDDRDLKLALCRLDPSGSYCPKITISSVSPDQIQAGASSVGILIRGGNFPEDAEVKFFIGNQEDDKIQIASIQRDSATQISIMVNVAADAEPATRVLSVYSEAQPEFFALSEKTIEITAADVALELAPTAPIFPAQVEPGQVLPTGIVIYGNAALKKVARIVINGSVFDDNEITADEITTSDNCDTVAGSSPVKPGCSNHFLATKPLTVLDSAQPGNYSINMYDAEGTSLGSATIAVAGTPQEPEVVGYTMPYWRDKDFHDLRTNLQAGPAIPVGDDNLHPLARGAEDQAPPAYRVELGGKLPIVGRPGLFPVDPNQFQLDLRGNASFEQHVHLAGEPDTTRLEVSPELDFAAPIVPYVTPDLRVRYSFLYNDEAYPNRRFFSGLTHRLNPELGLQLDRIWKEKLSWLSARPFISYQLDHISYDGETGFRGFEGTDHTGKAGAEVELRLRSDVSGSKAGTPDIALSGYGLWGTHEVPEIYQGLLLENSEEARSGFGFDGRFQWRTRIPYVQITDPAIRLVYERESLEGWDDTQRFAADLSAQDIARTGTWQLGFLYDQLDPYYGTEQTSVRLSWRPPVRWHLGRNGTLPFNAFSLNASVDRFAHPEIFGQEGSQTSVNAFVGFDPLQFFFPGEPVKKNR